MIEVSGGEIKLTGFPDDYLARSIQSPLVHRLNKLRFAQGRLKLARQTMELMSGLDQESGDSRVFSEAIAASASCFYFSCFASGSMSPQLSSDRVFKGQDVIKEWHDFWKNFRDRRFNHPSAVGFSIDTVLVLNASGQVEATRTLSLDVPVGIIFDWMNNLYKLIDFVERHVSEEATVVELKLRQESSRMTKEDLLHLPEPQIFKPSFNK